MKLTFDINPWSLPAPPVYLEGAPSPAQQAQEEADAAAARRVWTPGPEALAMLETLRTFVGGDVVVQAWDRIMLWLPEEGPFPLRAHCVDLLVQENAEGLLRAYLVLERPEVVRTPEGYEGKPLIAVDGERWLLDVDEVYEIETLR